MSYQLGIDFGTTSVAAAIRRPDAPDPEVVSLGGGDTVPAALHLARDGGVSVGESALRLAGIDPSRVVRAVKRRIGDPEPITVGREPWTAEDLSARLLRWVVDRVAEREGAPPATVALAHPASWSAATLMDLGAALARRDLEVTFVPEPVAVVHAARGGEPAIVVDLGGGRFEAAVVSAGALLGTPEGLPDVGGLDFDDLVLRHVLARLPAGVTPDARLRRACLRAKETLSTKTATMVRIRREDLQAEVRLTRDGFEQLIGAHVERATATLRRVVESAELDGRAADVLLVGGSARIPLVARAVAAEVGREVTAIDGSLVARGAALAAAVEPVTITVAAARGVRVAAGPAAPADVPTPDVPTPDVPTPDVPTPDVPTPDVPTPDVPTADPGADAPTVTIPAAAMAESLTMPYGMPAIAAEPAGTDVAMIEPVAADEPVLAESFIPESFPAESAAARPAEARSESPTASTASPAEPPAGLGPAAPAPAEATDPAEPAPAEPTDPAPRAAPVRVPAVLDPSPRRGGRGRSLPRLLVGAGALLVAVLVLVALFRADGPLDPPTEPVVGADAPHVPGAAGLPHPAAPPPVVEGVRAEVAPVTAPVAPRRASDARSVDLPVVPDVRTTGPRPTDVDVPRAEGPLGAVPRTPPTPVVPLV